MKKMLLLSLLVLALPAFADEIKIKAEQIKNNAGDICFRCDYVMQDGWVTKVINNGEEWKLKPKEALFILPLGLRPESILFQVYRVSPKYGKLPADAPPAATSSNAGATAPADDAQQPAKN